jgi:hypothetical protein
MMHLLHRFLLLLFSLSFISGSSLSADGEWELYHTKLYLENDLLSSGDSQYTGGTKLTLLYKIDNPDSLYNFLFVDDSKSYYFRSFAIGTQLYTPSDLEQTEPIYDDYSYAAWTYLESGIHKSTNKELSSLVLKVGMVGTSAKGEAIQKAVHKWTGSQMPQGWKNQLYDELGINLGYMHKKRYVYGDAQAYSMVFIPAVGFDLGNISTQASVGLFSRIGYNVLKDFGITTISLGAESNIPAYEAQKMTLYKHWSYSFNIALRASAVAKDIFVEGNSFKQSIVQHQRKNFVAYYGAGFSVRYKAFILDFMQIHNTSRAKDIDGSQSVGTLVLTYLFAN